MSAPETGEKEEPSPSKQMEEIVRCYNSIVATLASAPGVEGDYPVGRGLMRDAAASIEKSPGKALRTMRKAQEAFEAESKVVVGLQKIGARRASIPDYVISKQEMQLEAEIQALRQKENWKKASTSVDKLDELVRARSEEAIDIGAQLQIEDRQLFIGRPATLKSFVTNGSAFEMKIVSMTASPERQVSIFNEYRRTIAPRGQLTVRMNVTGLVEGDMVVEVKAEIETEGRKTSLVKQASLKVEAPPTGPREGVIPAQRDSQPRRTPNTVLPGPVSSGPDPLPMLVDASVQDWIDVLVYCQKNSLPLDLTGVATVHDHMLKKGYRNLLQAILVSPYERVMDWAIWYDDVDKGEGKGIIGDDFTRRIAPLLFTMTSSKEHQVEFCNDGGVGSSNRQKFTTALHIASGTIEMQKEERNKVGSWDIKVSLPSGDVDMRVVNIAIKDENGKNLKNIFRRVR